MAALTIAGAVILGKESKPKEYRAGKAKQAFKRGRLHGDGAAARTTTETANDATICAANYGA